MVNLHRYKRNYRSFILFLFSLILFSKIVFGETVNTGNILTNSTFGTGETVDTTGWSTGGDHGIHTHGEWGFPYQTGMDDGGGVLAFEGHTEDNVYQDVDLVGDGHLTQSELNQGFTSTMSADVWFWNSIENTFTLKQTITGSDGSVSTQVRNINDHHPNRSMNGGQFTNYTNIYTHGSNTQTDFTIRAEMYNETAGTTYDNSHRGPDVDNVTLNITYTDIPPINEETQDVIDDIDTDIVDIIEDIPEDFDWNTDDLYFDDTYTWENEYVLEEDFYFEEEFETIDFNIVDFEELPMFENFETMPEMDFEEIPIMEEVFFEDIMAPPPMEMMEEIFTEEFEEDFTDFLEETGMEEEFMEFLEDEGITAEEFFEEIAEEEFNDELTEESFEEFEEPMEEIATNEESVPEAIEEKEEAMEEPKSTETELVEEEKKVASNESTEESSPKEEESSSESSEESEVQPEDSEEQDGIQPEGREEVDTNDRIATDVAEVETKLKKNLKVIAKQIAKVTKETTQNLSKEDLFFKNNSLDVYKDIAFYSAKDIYDNTSMGLFLQIDLSSYSGEIYAGASLSSYTENDPVEVHRVKLLNINKTKNKLIAELEALKQ